MSYGCGGSCYGQMTQSEQLTDIRSKAKKDAVENQKTMAIYREGIELKYCEYEHAVREGYPITEMVSQYK